MATVKDAKQIMLTSNDPAPKIFFNFVFFYLHFFIWLILIACFGIVAEF